MLIPLSLHAAPARIYAGFVLDFFRGRKPRCYTSPHTAPHMHACMSFLGSEDKQPPNQLDASSERYGPNMPGTEAKYSGGFQADC